MAICYRLLLECLLIVSSLHKCVFCEKVESLYAETDPVVQLTNETIKRTLHGKSTAWIVQFYSSWCGHCQRFAPTWKKLSIEVAGWHDVINIAVVNCADSRNIETCRSYKVHAFPTVKLFKAFSLENDTGSAVKLTHDLILPELLKSIFEHLETHTSREVPLSWPILHPLLQLESIESLWDEPNQNRAHHLLIYEKPDSILGRQLILDTRNVKAIRTIRVFDTEDTRRLMQQKGATSLPSVLLCFRSSRCRILSPGSTERADFLTALRSFHTRSYHKDLVSIAAEDDGTKYKIPSEAPSKMLYPRNAVYVRDLESVIYYSLAMEAARQSILAGEMLDALKAYCAALAKYLPGRPLLLDFLRRLHTWLQQADKELNPQMLTDFMKKEWEMTGLPTETKWIGCRGSRPHYRGYPCGLWVLFHTLTVGAHKIINRDKDTNADPRQVLFCIWSFVKYFFGCRECGKNFQKMAVEIRANVNSTEDAMFWLWQSHNKVNKRLAGDLSEDPQFPKVQFPPEEFCPKCRKTGLEDTWNKAEVLNFLLWLYADSVRLEETNTQDSIRLPKQSNIKLVIPNQLKNFTIQVINGDSLQANFENNFVVETEHNKSNEVHKKQLSTALRPQSYPSVWGMNNVDISLCLFVYAMMLCILVLCYYLFYVRRRHKYALRGKLNV